MDGYLIEFYKSLSLWNSLLDKYSIQIFHIGQAYKFIDGGIIPNITFQVRIVFPPFLCCHSKHRYIQHIGFIGINDICLFGRYFSRNKILLDGIRMYPIVYL